MANNGKTLTGLGKWWGRKPVILPLMTHPIAIASGTLTPTFFNFLNEFSNYGSNPGPQKNSKLPVFSTITYCPFEEGGLILDLQVDLGKNFKN